MTLLSNSVCLCFASTSEVQINFMCWDRGPGRRYKLENKSGNVKRVEEFEDWSANKKKDKEKLVESGNCEAIALRTLGNFRTGEGSKRKMSEKVEM